MKNALRATALTCAVLAVCFSAPSFAKAAADSDVVRTAQMRLASQGFYVGRYDGMMGPTTQQAVMDFQRTNGLVVSGNLTPETFSLLEGKKYVTYEPAYFPARTDLAAYHTIYGQPVVLTNAAPVLWDNYWHYTRSQEIPSRYGKLDLNEDDMGTLRHYEVTLNGRPVLFANNQPSLLRVSKTYAMNGEDAVIFTAYHGDGVCAYKSYLMTIHSDGSFNSPKEIGNCTGNFEAHVADNALMISFPSTYLANGWATWDVWRYENNSLARI